VPDPRGHHLRDWNAVVDEDGKLDHTAELLLAEGIDTPAGPGLQ
jgi:hypothetical protein